MKRSILEELMSLAPKIGKHEFVSNTAENAYVSAIKLFEAIRENYSPADAEDLEKRFVNSIRSSDIRKFKRGIARIKREESA